MNKDMSFAVSINGSLITKNANTLSSSTVSTLISTQPTGTIIGPFEGSTGAFSFQMKDSLGRTDTMEMRGNASGWIGIGMDPQYPLDVTGTIRTGNLRVGGSLQTGGTLAISGITSTASTTPVINYDTTTGRITYETGSSTVTASSNVDYIRDNIQVTARNLSTPMMSNVTLSDAYLQIEGTISAYPNNQTVYTFGPNQNQPKWLSGGSGSNTLAYSYNGINWNGLGTSVTTDGRGIAWGGDKWVL